MNNLNMQKNYTDQQIDSLQKIEHIVLPVLAGESKDEHELFKKRFLGIFKQAIPVPFVNKFIGLYFLKQMRNMANKSNCSLYEIEQKQRGIFRKLVSTRSKIKKGLIRSKVNFLKVKPYLINQEFKTILDLGSGNGLIAYQMSIDQDFKNKRIITADVIDYRFDVAKSIEFFSISQNNYHEILNQSIDATLLYVVVHHSDEPKALIKLVTDITKKTIVLVEGFVEEKIEFNVNGTMDWWLNRVGQDVDINVPIHYLTKQEWSDLFNSHGFELTIYKDIGIDDVYAPERHCLIVANRKEIKHK